jgi:hypothetical protein
MAVVLVGGCGGSSGNDLFGSGAHAGAGGRAAGGISSTGGTSRAGGTSSTGGTSNTGGVIGNAGAGGASGAGGIVAQTGGAGGAAAGAPPVGGADSGPPPPCVQGTQEACACASGGGTRTCNNGAFGACVCGACQEGVQSPCSCPNGSPGVANCTGGKLSGCIGCPVGPSGCPVGMACTRSGTSSTPYCGDGTGLPPGCTVNADCAALGVNCLVLPLAGGLCFKTCTP